MLPAPLCLAFVRAMLVVDDGTRITPLSPHGEGNKTRILLFSHCQNKYTHMGKNNTDGQSLPRVGKAIKLSGRTFLAPHRGSSPKGLCKQTGFLGVKRRENPVRRHFE